MLQKPTPTMKNDKSCKALPTKIRTQTSNWQVNQETRQNRESFETRDIPQIKGVNQDSSNKRRCHIGMTSLHVFAWDHAACSRNHDGMNCLERLHKWCRAWYHQWQIPSCHDLRGQIYRGVSWRKDFACTSIVSWNIYLPFKKKKLKLNNHFYSSLNHDFGLLPWNFCMLAWYEFNITGRGHPWEPMGVPCIASFNENQDSIKD